MKKRWAHSNKAIYNIGYHLIWCPKYRRRILVDKKEIRLKELLLEKSQELQVVIEKMKIMQDHVHLFVKAAPTDSPHWIVQQLKGYTSRIIGHLSEETIKRYIEEKKNQ